jgi:hypothetical protein
MQRDSGVPQYRALVQSTVRHGIFMIIDAHMLCTVKTRLAAWCANHACMLSAACLVLTRPKDATSSNNNELFAQ